MAATHVQTHAGGQQKSAGSTFSIALSALVNAGNTLIVVIGFDNRASGLGGGPTVTGISTPTSPNNETASWQLLFRLDAPSATGGNTVITEVWGIVTTVNWASVFAPIVTLSASIGAKAAVVDEWSNLSLNIRDSASNLSTAGTPSAAITGAAVGDVLIGGSVFESVTAPTGDSDTTGGSWSTNLSIGTTGAGDTSNLTANLQTKIVTATGTQTYNPTGANDSGAVLLALQPTLTGTTTNPTAIGSAEAFGTPTLPQSKTSTPTAIGEVLAPVRAALAARETTRVNIGLFGASLAEGFPALGDKTIEEYLAAKLRARYPTSGNPAGYGLVPIPSGSMGPYSMWTITPGTGGSVGTSNATNGWAPNHQVWFTNGSLALPPILVATLVGAAAGASSCDIDLLRVVGYSATAGKYRIDGGSWVNFTLAPSGGVTQVEKLHIAGPINTTLEISIETGNPASYVIVLDAVFYKGDESKGIHIHNFGHSGYRANQWIVDANPTYGWRQAQALQGLHLLLLGDLGVNDAQSLSSAQYRTDLIALLNYIKAGPEGSLPMLAYSAYDMTAGVTFVEPWANYVAVNKEVFANYNIPHIDLRDAMPATPNAIYHTDNAHGNANGAAYDIMADILFRAIVSEIGEPTVGLGAVPTAPAAIGSGEAFGSPTIGTGASAITCGPTSIASAEAVGTPTLSTLLTTSPTGVGSGEVWGVPTLSTPVGVAPTGIASAGALGVPSLATLLGVAPTGVASAEGFGTTALTPKLSVAPVAIASVEGFGTTSLALSLGLGPTGASSAEAFGNPVLGMGSQTVSPTGVASAGAFGAPVIGVGGLAVSPVAIASAEALGAPILASILSVSPTGIASVQGFGTTVLAHVLSVSPTGVGSAVAFGTPVLSSVLVAGPTSIGSGEAFGGTSLQVPIGVGPSGIVSAGAFGIPLLALMVTVTPVGVASAEAEGNPSFLATVTAGASAVVSAEAFGLPFLGAGLVLAPTGIASAQGMGTPALVLPFGVAPVGVASAEGVGTPSLVVPIGVAPVGIASAQAIGVPSLASGLVIAPTGAPSAVAFGAPTLAHLLGVSPNPITSGEALGAPSLSTSVLVVPVSILGAEALGSPVIEALLFLSPDSIGTGEAFGEPSLVEVEPGAWAPAGDPQAEWTSDMGGGQAVLVLDDGGQASLDNNSATASLES